MAKLDKEEKVLNYLQMYATITLIVAVLPFIPENYAMYIYMQAGFFYAFTSLIQRLKVKGDLIKQRISRMNLFASALLIISVVARFGLLENYGRNLWIFFFLLSGVFIIYANIIILRAKDE